MRIPLTRVILAFPIILFAGCGGDGPFPISGKITIDGAPLAGAGITLTPKEGGRPAFGETDESGTFHITTSKSGDGAMRGVYRVTVVWAEKQHPYLDYREGAPERAKLYKDYLEWKAKHVEKPSPVPQKYGEPATTPLELIVSGAKRNADFDIKTKG